MAQQVIGIKENGGTLITKLNNNFTELYAGYAGSLPLAGGTLTGNLVIDKSTINNTAAYLQLRQNYGTNTQGGGFEIYNGTGATPIVGIYGKTATSDITGSMNIYTSNALAVTIGSDKSTTFYGGLKASNNFNVLANGTGTEVRIGGSALSWADNFDILQINSGGFFNDPANMRLLQNTYYNNGYKRINEDYPNGIWMGSGNTFFQHADTSTADSIITFVASFQTGITGNAFGTSTVKTWDTDTSNVQIGASGSIHSQQEENATTKYVGITCNGYRSSSTWKYKTTDEFSNYQQYNGNHYFNHASSGSADATVTLIDSLKTGKDGFGVFGNQALQQNHIANATDLTTVVANFNTLLASLEAYGLLKAS